MGMYDSFYVEKGVLPENSENEDQEFQTKCLDCNLDVYKVDKNLNVTANKLCGEKITQKINDCAFIYSYVFDGEITREQHYKIIIINNKIEFVEKIE